VQYFLVRNRSSFLLINTQNHLYDKGSFVFSVMEVVCGEHGSYHSLLIQAAKSDTWKKEKHVPGTLSMSQPLH
jgi:hypothetical protein